MDEVLRFFRHYEGWIYFLLVLGGLVYLRRLFAYWRDMHGTIFGLERDSAQIRFNQSITVLVLLILIGIGEFVIVSYIAPLRPEANPLLTPTIDLLATATATLPPDQTPDAMAETEIAAEPTATPDARIGTCVPGVLEITSPEPGDQILGAIPIIGSVNVGNLGFYKLEVTPQNQATWRSIQADRVPVVDGELVSSWDTSTLAPGDYLLRLVVEDNAGNPFPDCQVAITILSPQE